MRRSLTFHPLLLLQVLLLASSQVSGLQTSAGGDASLVVFSSFPTFAPQTGGGPRAPTTGVLHSNFKEKLQHGVPSDPQDGLTLTANEGLAKAARNTNTDKNDAPNTGIFLVSTLMKKHRHETSTDAEEFTTTMTVEVPEEATVVSEPTENSDSFTDNPVLVPSTKVSSSSSLTTRHPRTSTFAQEPTNQGHPDEMGKSGQMVTEESVSPGSLASMLLRMKSGPRPSAKPAPERKEKKESPQQITLADRLRALQARRAARLGSQGRRGTGLLTRNKSPFQARESPVQRRLGDFSIRNPEGNTRQETLPVEPKISAIDSRPESEGEQKIKKNEDMVDEGASLVHTIQSEQTRPETSAPTSIRPAFKKPQRLSYTQRLRSRLQELRQRRLSSTTPRPRFPRPGNISRPRATPGPKTENTTAALTPSQLRRQKFYQRLRNRSSTTRAPDVIAPRDKVFEATSEASVIKESPKRLSLLPTTKRPLSFREKIQQFRSRNRFVPSAKRRQLTSTTTATTTTTTSTTPPPTTITTIIPTTIGTTPAPVFNTWPVTQTPDDDNFLITDPSTTELSEDSRRHQIRKMIDAMLSSKGFSGQTTTEQVLSLLEIATSRPVFMHTTESLLRTLPEHRATSSPTFAASGSEDETSHSEAFLNDLLTTITESVSLPTTHRTFTASARDRPKLLQNFPSLADKLAASHAPKRSKYEPSTPLTTTTEESLLTTHQEQSAGVAEETDIDATTTALDVEITTPSLSSFTVASVDEDEESTTTQEPLAGTTTEDQRVKNLVSKLLAQGVITLPQPDDSEPVTPSMEDDLLPTTTDILPPELLPFLPSKQPQLTRGAPPIRTAVRFKTPFTDNPLASTVKMMDTTAKFSRDDTEVTEAPQTTTLDDVLLQTNLFQTIPPVTDAGDSVFDIAGDLEENEIDAVNSKDNLHSLMRSFGRSSIRPELAAVNQVLGFSLTTDDDVSPVEVNLEKPQTPGEENIYNDMEVAATEQVFITTSLKDEDLTSTPINLDVTSFSVSEASPQIHSATEATNLFSTDIPEGQHQQTGKESQTRSMKEALQSIEENPDEAKSFVTLLPVITSTLSAIQTSTTTSSAPDSVDPHHLEKDSADKHPASASPSLVAKETLARNATADSQPDNKNVTVSLQKFMRPGEHEKVDVSSSNLTVTFQGVSQAVLRERLHLLRLMRNRQGGRTGQETSLETLRTTSESPLTSSRVSLSDLIRKKTSGEIAGLQMTPKPRLSESNTTADNAVTTASPEHGVAATTKQTQTQSTSKTSDAMRRFLELNKHVLQTLRIKKKATTATNATPPPTTPTSPTTLFTMRHSVHNLGTQSAETNAEAKAPVINQVTPQSQMATAATPTDLNHLHGGTKVRTSSLLRPVSLLPNKNETPRSGTQSLKSISASNVQGSTSHDHIQQQIKEEQKVSTPGPEVTTSGSRIPSPFRVRRPHPTTKFSLSRPLQDSPEHHQQKPGTVFMPGLPETVVEGPQVVSTTSRPLLQLISTTRANDVPPTEITKPEELTTDVSLSSETPTEEPNAVKVTTLSSLLNRKLTPGTRLHQTKQKPTTVLPKMTIESIIETTKLPEDDTLAPVTLPPQEETTIIPQLPQIDLQNTVPQVDQSKSKLRQSSFQPPLIKATNAAPEGMTVEHVSPPFSSQDTSLNFRTGLQGRPTGAFTPDLASFNVPGGVPLPSPATGLPHTVFATTTPSIQFEPTHAAIRLPNRQSIYSLDTSATTESPSTFPSNPQDLTDEKTTLTPPTFAFDLDTSTQPLGSSFQLQRKHFNSSVRQPPSSSILPFTNNGPVTAGGDEFHGKPLPFVTTTTPGIASFTLGRNEAFFSDDDLKTTTFHPSATDNPVTTTPITTVTPQVILLALPVVNDSLVASSLPEEDAEKTIPITIPESENEQPGESLTPPDLQHMITKGVTITSTEGVIDRVLPTAAPESPSPPHSLLVPPPIASTLLNNAEQNSPENILQKEDENLRLRLISEPRVVVSEHSLGATEEKKIRSKTTLNEQQGLINVTRRPSLQAGHLNLNELRQRHLAGQVTEMLSPGLPTPLGFQEQQIGSQAFLGQPDIPGHQSDIVATGQLIPHHPKEPPRDQHDDIVHGNTFEQRKGASGHDSTLSMQPPLNGQTTHGQNAVGAHNVNKGEQTPKSQLNVSQQNAHQHDTLTQQNFNDHIRQSQQSPQIEVSQNQDTQQKQITQSQHNLQGLVIQGQHEQQGHIIQGQHKQQGDVVRGQHSQREQVIKVHHNQQGHTIQSQDNSHRQAIHDQHNPQTQIIQSQQDLMGQVDDHRHSHQVQPPHSGVQGTHTTSEGHQSTKGQSRQVHDLAKGQFFQEQDVIQGHISQGQDGIKGDNTQRKLSEESINQGPEVHEEHFNHEQGVINQEKASQGQEVTQEQTSQGVIHVPSVQEKDEAQEQVEGKQSSPTQHTLQDGEVTTKERQQDDKQHVTAQPQHFQNSPSQQPNFRRGKFITGDAILEAQLITPGKNFEGKLIVENVHGSGGPIITGQSVVPPLRASRQHQSQQLRGVQTTFRGQTREQNFRHQRQKVHLNARQMLATPASPPTPPRGQETVGHFSNTAAGFLRGPANSVITRFASHSDDLPAGGGEGDFLTTVLPAKAKVFGSRHTARQDSDGDEIPGQAGVDYPILTRIPVTAFTCTRAMAHMMFADPDTKCQVYHVCSEHQKYSFLCPKGTLFNQDTSVCQWWFTVDCARQARRLAEVRGLTAG